MLWILLGMSLLNTDCEQQYLNQMKTDMDLSYQEFDQTMDQGFRRLAKTCKSQAIDLIKNYIIVNQAEQDSLRWHIAQLAGELGRYEEAILYAKTTLRVDDTGALKWNDYVMGYMAYWESDVETLKEKIDVLEATTEHQGNAINAKLLRRFMYELSDKEVEQ
ncbi:MAG: hypothetical protein R3E90_09545 [Marinicella sp.]|nr:hypothetical protein [Xanthomonadales bacterium]